MRAADPFSTYGESPFDVVSALARKRAGEIRVIDEAEPPGVAEPGWEVPQVLECDKTASDFAPRVAMNAAGQGMAIWCRREGECVRLWTRICTQSEGWGQAEPMNTDDAIGIGFPQIAMDARGHAIVAWRRFVDPVSGIWVNRYVPNLGWTGATLLQQEKNDEVFDPRIAMNDRGDAVVVWQQSTATHNTVWASRHVAGAGWEQPTRASQDGVSDASAPRVAMDASGNAMVVWRQFDGVSTSIWANLFDISRGWGVADVLDVEQGGTAFDAQIVMSPSGNAIAIWTQTSREHSRIYASHYLVGRGWGRTARVGANGDMAALLPQLAMDERGNAMAVWCQRDGKRFHVHASRYQAGGAWSLPLRVDAGAVSGAGDSCDPQLAMDAEGAAIVVWHQVNGVQRGIWASRYQLGAEWSRAHELKTPGGGDAFEPQVVMNKEGRALALWQAWTDSHFSVLASMYR
jgi:hypothetical protein